MKASRYLLLAITLTPALMLGQKKEDLVNIQRDVADMTDQIKQIRKSTDEKFAALSALVQQSIDLSNKTLAAMSAMQRDTDAKMAEQQTKLVAPVATLGSKVDEMSGDFGTVRESVRELVRKVNDMDGKVNEINLAIRTLNTPAVTPPPPANGVPVAGTAQTPDGPPAGQSAETAYQTAYSDYSAKKDDLALEEFGHYVRYYPQSANAANAQYFIGQIYYRAEDWESASKAFDAVLEKFPKNAKTPDAQYMKACALMNWKGHKTQAATEFKSFIATYPAGSPHVADAHKHLRDLGMDSPARRTK